MRLRDDEIQRKLVELETAILKEQKSDIAPLYHKSSELRTTTPAEMQSSVSSSTSSETKSNLHYYGGMGLILLGLFLLLQHVKLSSGYSTWWGMTAGDSIGFILVPLLVGVGWIFYNSRSVWGWLIMVVSLVLTVFTIISGLRMYFIPLSMISVILMLLPMTAGVAFVLKGMGGPAGIDAAIRNRIEKK